ncbi:MAG: hypothetical protein WC391_08165 [Methanoregula sp.]|jgi:hypothetical protein
MEINEKNTGSRKSGESISELPETGRQVRNRTGFVPVYADTAGGGYGTPGIRIMDRATKNREQIVVKNRLTIIMIQILMRYYFQGRS